MPARSAYPPAAFARVPIITAKLPGNLSRRRWRAFSFRRDMALTLRRSAPFIRLPHTALVVVALYAIPTTTTNATSSPLYPHYMGVARRANDMNLPLLRWRRGNAIATCSGAMNSRRTPATPPAKLITACPHTCRKRLLLPVFSTNNAFSPFNAPYHVFVRTR